MSVAEVAVPTSLAAADDVEIPAGTPLTDEQRAMVKTNRGLVYWLVAKMRLGDELEEEAVAAGMLGLIRAVQKFDPNRGFKFSTYAIHWIRKAIAEDRERFEGVSYRAWKRANHGVDAVWRQPDSIDADVNEGLTVADLLVSDENPELDAVDPCRLGDAGDVALAACQDDLDVAVVLGLAQGLLLKEIDMAAPDALQRVRRLREAVGVQTDVGLPSDSDERRIAAAEIGDAIRSRLADLRRTQAWLGAEIAAELYRPTPYRQTTVSQWLLGITEWTPSALFAAERILGFRAGDLSRHLGYLPLDAVPARARSRRLSRPC